MSTFDFELSMQELDARAGDRKLGGVSAAKLAEAEKFIAGVQSGRYPVRMFQEAMSTSDFSNLFGAAIDRRLYAAYQEWAPMWRAIVAESRVSDFRTAKRHASDLVGQMSQVDEYAEYPEGYATDEVYNITPVKWGRRIRLSFETWTNDDLGRFMRLPADLARVARANEDEQVTRLFVGASGPSASVYTVGNANIVTSNPVFSATNLATAITQILGFKDANNIPIYHGGFTVMVPPALMIAAKTVISAATVEVIASAGSQQVLAPNWVRDFNITVVTNQWIPVIASSNANTSWFVFANPTTTARPAGEIAFLSSEPTPSVFEKIPDARRVGGGEVMESFANDAREWKVRSVFGVAAIDPKSTVASNGSGS